MGIPVNHDHLISSSTSRDSTSPSSTSAYTNSTPPGNPTPGPNPQILTSSSGGFRLPRTTLRENRSASNPSFAPVRRTSTNPTTRRSTVIDFADLINRSHQPRRLSDQEARSHIINLIIRDNTISIYRFFELFDYSPADWEDIASAFWEENDPEFA